MCVLDEAVLKQKTQNLAQEHRKVTKYHKQQQRQHDTETPDPVQTQTPSHPGIKYLVRGIPPSDVFMRKRRSQNHHIWNRLGIMCRKAVELNYNLSYVSSYEGFRFLANKY